MHLITDKLIKAVANIAIPEQLRFIGKYLGKSVESIKHPKRGIGHLKRVIEEPAHTIKKKVRERRVRRAKRKELISIRSDGDQSEKDKVRGEVRFLLLNASSRNSAPVIKCLARLEQLLTKELFERHGDNFGADDYQNLTTEWLEGAMLGKQEGSDFIQSIQSGQGIAEVFFALQACTFLNENGREGGRNANFGLANTANLKINLINGLVYSLVDRLSSGEEVPLLMSTYNRQSDPKPKYFKSVLREISRY